MIGFAMPMPMPQALGAGLSPPGQADIGAADVAEESRMGVRAHGGLLELQRTLGVEPRADAE